MKTSVVVVLVLASVALTADPPSGTGTPCPPGTPAELCEVLSNGLGKPTFKTMAYSTTPLPTVLSLQQILHSYADKHVNQTDLDYLLELLDTIITRGIGYRQKDATVLQDIENIVRNANISTERYKIEALEKVAVAVDTIEGNTTSTRTMIFKKITNNAETNKSWSIDISSGNEADEKIDEMSNTVVVKFPPMNTSALLTAIVYPETNMLLQERDRHSRRRLNSVVVNVNAYSDDREVVELPYLDVVFKHIDHPRGCEKDICSFWNHSETDEGIWSDGGCTMIGVSNGKVFCRCTHLTHFGALIQQMPKELGHVHSLVLDVITYLGCLMSLAGVTRIVIVAATNSQWRRDAGHKLVLCLAVNVALLTTLFLPVAIGSVPSRPGCTVIGAGLHYLLLASFMWTLVSAYLQYRRFVIGICTPITRLILKTSLLSWILPILPVAVLLIIDTDIYTNNNVACHDRTYCFPTNRYFYMTVAGPIGLIILANVFIFIRIVLAFYGCYRIVHPTSGGIKRSRVLMMVIFEFFLLGLPWAFGLMAEFGIFFLYLFCITATQQGFILFLFFVFLKKQDTVKHTEGSSGIRAHQRHSKGSPMPENVKL